MSVLYGVISIVALALVGVCIAVDKKRDIYLLCMFISVFVCNLGYFLISVSKTVEFALNANRIAYLGQVFLPFFLFMMLMGICKIEYPKYLPKVLCGVGIAILLIAASPGIVTWYYKSAHIKIIDGTTFIVREHGPLHALYYVYLGGYFAVDAFIVVRSIATGKVVSKLHAFFLMATVFCNIVVWFIGQLLPRGFEYLSLSYITTEVFILLLYGILQEYNFMTKNVPVAITVPENNISPTVPTDESGDGQTVEVWDDEDSNGELFTPSDIERMVAGCETMSELTGRERDVLRCILSNKRRKDIASDLHVSESTIKKHTSSVYRKLSVGNRLELFAKLKQYIR